MNIALLTIATGKYISFAKNLCESAKKYFLSEHNLEIFIFTDNQEVPKEAHRIGQQHKPFPYPTLMRYHIFTDNEDKIKGFDYYFYSDIDMLFVDAIEDGVLGSMAAVRHPGFFRKNRNEFSYETRPQSVACVCPNEGIYYFAGGFNGGKNYLSMAHAIRKMVDIDASKNIVAVWHDESYMNRYLIDNPPDVVLSPAYVYPDGNLGTAWGLQDIKPKLIALNKDHKYFRETTI